MKKNKLVDLLEESRQQNGIEKLAASGYFGDKKITIYGAGAVGKYACDILLNLKLNVSKFLDRSAYVEREYRGVKIERLEDQTYRVEEAVVILCVLCNSQVEESIIKKLNEKGYRSIIPFKQKAFSNDNMKSDIFREQFMWEYKAEIIKAYELFEDVRSKEIYEGCMETFMKQKFEFESVLDNEQYFPDDILLNKGYSHFVDCGAYNGDTINRLMELKKDEVKMVTAIEPNRNSLSELKVSVEKWEDKKFNLYNCAVSDRKKKCPFKIDAVYNGAMSSLNEIEGEIINCEKIDDLLDEDALPTLIKMDIEGEEYKALLGAKETIKRFKPDLAICVYHYVDHYFKIPLLIDAMGLGYKFYLRNYAEKWNETVLYATTDVL